MGIGNRIKLAREQAKLNQRELAGLIGVSPSAITNYENETSHPKEEKLYALMSALNVDANFLFHDVMEKLGIKKAPDAKPEADKSTEETLLSILRNSGAIPPGHDLTEGQANALIAVGTLLSEIFQRDK